ncbi:uncharacterized protein LOC127281965 [Leptopilina boulardi]|uniref:uncharacterized protein LOC127281965 n=1 Tax=Leptopilina boulardi TaxID=63433 RepID=UPI0021F50572|nr:uncharacterized protein LOC127281965 [Leptopilina boulardi]
MKSLKKVFLFLFVLIQLNIFCLSKSIDDNSEEDKLEQFLKEIAELPSQHLIVKRDAVSEAELNLNNPIPKEDLIEFIKNIPKNKVKLPELIGVLAKTPFQLYSERRRKLLLAVIEKLDELTSKISELNLTDEEAKPLIEVDEDVHNKCVSNEKTETSELRQCMLEILKTKEIELLEKREKKSKKFLKSLKILKAVEVVVEFGQKAYEVAKEFL